MFRYLLDHKLIMKTAEIAFLLGEASSFAESVYALSGGTRADLLESGL